jgi:metallopeptidase MepB
MYSLVFASDMYATVFKANPLDPVRGDKYRRCILKPGGSREELDSLEVGRILLPHDRMLTAP